MVYIQQMLENQKGVARPSTSRTAHPVKSCLVLIDAPRTRPKHTRSQPMLSKVAGRAVMTSAASGSNLQNFQAHHLRLSAAVQSSSGSTGMCTRLVAPWQLRGSMPFLGGSSDGPKGHTLTTAKQVHVRQPSLLHFLQAALANQRLWSPDSEDHHLLQELLKVTLDSKGLVVLDKEELLVQLLASAPQELCQEVMHRRKHSSPHDHAEMLLRTALQRSSEAQRAAGSSRSKSQHSQQPTASRHKQRRRNTLTEADLSSQHLTPMEQMVAPLPAAAATSSAVSRQRSRAGAAVAQLTGVKTVCLGVAQAQGERPYMEDRYCLLPEFRPADGSGKPVLASMPMSYAVVCDGHGGSMAAEATTADLHVTLGRLLGSLAPARPLAQQAEEVRRAFKFALKRKDDEILDAARSGAAMGGCTCTAALRLGSDLFIAHVGDSRAVLGRQGVAQVLTRDHRPCEPEERARVEAAGGSVRNDRVMWYAYPGAPRGDSLAVSRALGDLKWKEPQRLLSAEPDVAHVAGQPGDCVVLASDGLWDVVSPQQAVEVAQEVMLREGQGESGAQAAAEALRTLACAREVQDNVTVVVMALGAE